jgi:hypothetical protein
MSEHKATIHWRRETADFKYENYNRDHNWDSTEEPRSGPRPRRPTWGALRASIRRKRSSPVSRAATC